MPRNSRHHAACRRRSCKGLAVITRRQFKAPTTASGAFRCPARALGAPQTICSGPSGDAVPAWTPGTRAAGRPAGAARRSGSSATRMPLKGGRHRTQSLRLPGRPSSADRPAALGVQRGVAELAQPGFGELHVVAQAGAVSGIGTGNAGRSSKNSRRSVDAVAQHGQAVRAHAEGKTDVTLRVQPEAAHHVRVHLAGTGDLQPACPSRGPLAKGQVDLGRGLGEREKRRAGNAPRRSSVSKNWRRKSVKTDLQVLEADVFADPQAFALVEHR